jgi:BirA family biotin operon repressor/biotin-[acetyl-CoA-carboxylase] ligase
VDGSAGTPDDADAPLDVAALADAIRDVQMGHPLIYLPATGSTNSYALELARDGAAEGTLVLTDDQTAGRGRVGRAWKSLPGQQLVLSLILYPTFPPHFLVMASALAVAGAVADVTGLVADIKWPNDVQIAERKVSGILIETSGEYAVLGIGLNVNGSLADDPDLSARATTLAQAAGGPVAREAVAAALLRRLDALYGRLQTGGELAQRQVRAEWRARLVTLGRRVTLRQGQHEASGLAADVSADGGLVLHHDDGTVQTVTWGDVDA